MKIVNFYFTKLILGMLLISLFSSVVSGLSEVPKSKKKKSSNNSNSNEAPTMPERLKTSNYTAPLLSRSLLESDPTRKMRRPEFIETFKYSLYEMSRGEAEQIFAFVDQNKDDLIDHKEWDSFVSLFILPFEACDTNKNNILELGEFSTCFDADPKTKFITFRKKYQEKRHKMMIAAVSNRSGAKELNFADYLLLRKALFGWKQCHSNNKFIAKSHFRCALGASLPKFYAKADIEQIYTTGLKSVADRSLTELDFISYLKTLYYVYVFEVFNMPSDSMFMERQQFIKAVKEDRLPIKFEESEVDVIYELVNNSPTAQINQVSVIDFKTWVFFFTSHRKFNRYSSEKPNQLNLKEFKLMLNDSFMNKEILMAIDSSFTRFNQSNYEEASLVLQKNKMNEKDFFYARFKEDVSKAKPTSEKSGKADPKAKSSSKKSGKPDSNYYSLKPNTKNREIFFSIFVDTNKSYWTKLNMFRAFQLANLYVELTDYTHETQTRTVSSSTLVEKLPKAYDQATPVINMKQRSNYVLYKSIPRSVEVDMLTFLSLENFYTKFQIQTMSSNLNLEETKVKIILKDYGMENMPDTVLDLASKGYDDMHRRTFTPLELAKNCVIVQAVASENLRMQRDIVKHKLKVNNEVSRKFPNFARRFKSSDKI